MEHPKKFLRSVISYIPLLNRIFSRTGTGGSDSGQYCINEWRKHRKNYYDNADITIKKVAEVGPGDSIGQGLCALLEGVEKYIALDSVSHVSLSTNKDVLRDIVRIYEREGIDFNKEMSDSLEKEIQDISSSDIVKYYVPWWQFDEIEKNEIDLIISTAVLEHVDDLESFYSKAYDTLRKGGVISSVIDYGAHEFSKNWFGHYYYSDSYWRFLLHGRKYSINRFPHSYHISIMEKCGFSIVKDDRRSGEMLDINKVAPSVKRNLTKDDWITRSGVIVGIK